MNSRRNEIGESVLLRRVPSEAYLTYSAEVVRTLDGFHQISAIRSAVFLTEQECPYEEEFDGNDLCATHLVLKAKGRPVGTLRIRWFAEFAKLERIALLPCERGRVGLRVLLATGFEIVSRKGYRRMVGQIQARLWPVWSRTFNCRLIESRPPFWFSGYEYKEIEIPIPPHPLAIQMQEDPYRIIRPEGAWDEPGVLDASARRAQSDEQAA
jgi:predicted GNAT family N-acyltransferase